MTIRGERGVIADLEELSAAFERLADVADKEHRIAQELVAQFIELTKATAPLMRVCTDVDVLTKFEADVRRINDVISGLVVDGGLH